jgi:hypothetical protein
MSLFSTIALANNASVASSPSNKFNFEPTISTSENSKSRSVQISTRESSKRITFTSFAFNKESDRPQTRIMVAVGAGWQPEQKKIDNLIAAFSAVIHSDECESGEGLNNLLSRLAEVNQSEIDISLAPQATQSCIFEELK